MITEGRRRKHSILSVRNDGSLLPYSRAHHNAMGRDIYQVNGTVS